MERKLGRSNEISAGIEPATSRTGDRPAERAEMYRFLADVAREASPGTELALCLEEEGVMDAAGLSEGRGRCNCVL